MTARVEVQTIRRRDEECDCLWCGWPLDVGDKVYSISDSPACSRGHARAIAQADQEYARRFAAVEVAA